MSRVEVHYGSASDVGLVRTVNEDASLASPPVFVVADGMGGHQGGDVASSIVVEEFARLSGDYDATSATEAVTNTIQQCHRRIVEFGAERSGGANPWYAGTTAVIALLVHDEGEPKWLLANLGDSRVYRVHDAVLEQVSVDHSVVQELVDSGRITAEAAAHHPERHVITKALGGPDQPVADFFLLPLISAERLLLCSDGVSGLLAPEQLADILGGCEDPRDAAEQLVAAALAAGGTDNATAVVVDVVGLTEATDAPGSQVSLEEKLGALP